MPNCRIDLRQQIIAEAQAQGVPPEIALSVAAQESGICHWAPNGNVVLGKPTRYGQAIGMFQLLQSTADNLGVDPYDVDDNIHGGVMYLRQLYDQYGNWFTAVQHYYGSGPTTIPYAQSVMARADRYAGALSIAGAGSNSSGTGAGSRPGAVDLFNSLKDQVANQVANLSPKTKTVLVAGSVIAAGLLLAYNLSSDT